MLLNFSKSWVFASGKKISVQTQQLKGAGTWWLDHRSSGGFISQHSFLEQENKMGNLDA